MSYGKTYISIGDLIDLYYKLKEKSWIQLLSRLKFSKQGRALSKWNQVTTSSDFWNIPEIRRRWNEKCTGDPALEYEDYFVTQYLSARKGLKMLSVGCGAGSRERKFAKFANFEAIEGVDMAYNQVKLAQKIAREQHLEHLKYHHGDFLKLEFQTEGYELVLFNSSLHHFRNIDALLKDKVLPILKPGGFLVIFEYTGPNRLQWTDYQLEYSNTLLKELPGKYRERYLSRRVKKKIYRPGLIRMKLADPSEAVESELLLPAIHKYFRTIEEKRIGWDITHLLLKHIAHNFLDMDHETQHWLRYIFEKEDLYLKNTGRSDAVFGIYQK